MDDDLDNEDLAENKYKINKTLLSTMQKEKKKVFSLPIKTEDGQVLQNFKRIHESSDEEENDKEREIKNKIKTSKNKENELVKDDKPKSVLEIIREKTQTLERNKEKIAFLSRQIIANPQIEVKL